MRTASPRLRSAAMVAPAMIVSSSGWGARTRKRSPGGSPTAATAAEPPSADPRDPRRCHTAYTTTLTTNAGPRAARRRRRLSDRSRLCRGAVSASRNGRGSSRAKNASALSPRQRRRSGAWPAASSRAVWIASGTSQIQRPDDCRGCSSAGRRTRSPARASYDSAQRWAASARSTPQAVASPDQVQGRTLTSISR